MSATHVRPWKPIAVAALAALFVAIVGGSLTVLGPWYYALQKPDWQPPDWLFAPAWTLIFALTALSAADAWHNAGNRRDREWIVGLYSLNGAFNLIWSLTFFRLQRPDWAVVAVVLLGISILLMMLFVNRLSKRAALLLVPYLLWIIFAGVLNWSVVQLNAPFGAS